MPAVEHVLVVGGGLAGAATAIQLAGGGVAVDLVEIKPDVAALGSGITLQGNALRELQPLGVWDQVAGEGLRLRQPRHPRARPAGTRHRRDRRRRRPADRTCPPTVGMPRPGARPHPARPGGQRPASKSASARPSTELDAGRRRRRRRRSPTAPPAATTSSSAPTASAPGPAAQLGIDLETKAIGMGIWRAFGPRPASVTRTDLYYGGPATSPATARPARTRSTPTSSRTRRTAAGSRPTSSSATMKRAGRGLPRPVGRHPRDARRPDAGSTTPGSRPTSSTRRGTAAGSCSSATPRTPARPPSPRAARRPSRTPPSSPSCCSTRDALDDGLWDAFHARRSPRAQAVVDASNQLAQWLLDHEQGDVPGLMRRIATLVSQPRLNPSAPRSNPMTERLITHLRHVDLAVPDFDTQLDFYTNTWGLTSRAQRLRAGLPGRRGLAGAVRRAAAAVAGQADRPDLVRRRDRRPTSTPWPQQLAARRRPAGQRARHAADPGRRLRLPVLRQRGPHRRGQRRRRGPAAPQDRGGRVDPGPALPRRHQLGRPGGARAPSTRSTSASPCPTP